MAEAVPMVLGFVSASLVALIAIGFGALFLFFSGSALLVLGQFLPFARTRRVAGGAIGTTVGLVLVVSLAGGAPPPWAAASSLAWGLAGGVGYALICLPRLRRVVTFVLGAVLLVCGLFYVVSVFVPTLGSVAQEGLLVCLAIGLVLLAGLGPLVIGGLVEHVRTRRIEWFVSLRYLLAKRRQTFISVITVICVGGVALGVAVITVVLSVMNGFARTWEDKIVGNRSHFVVQSRAGPFSDYAGILPRVRQVEGVLGATPFVFAEAIIRGEAGELQGVMLKGIDPESVSQATEIAQDMVLGSLGNLDPDPGAEGPERYPGLVIGVELADRFFLRVGDRVIVISPLGGPLTPLGPAPRMERFRVAGIFKSDFYQFDESFVYTSIAAAQKFLKLEDVATGIEVRTDDPYRSRVVGSRVAELLGGLFYVQDWKEFYPGFFQALKTERVMMFVLLSFIMVVAGFIIVATLIMMIMDRSRDIAILKAMGCEDDAILRIFAIGGGLIGVIGLVLGLGMGLVITSNLDTIQLIVERTLGFDVLPGDVYQLQNLPFDVVPFQLALISLIAMTLSLGATLLPSWQAARLDPAEALRYE
ncbi:MAG: lipoprotein-releasing ABC transporter permease subunit [Myxococcota bacterium]